MQTPPAGVKESSNYFRWNVKGSAGKNFGNIDAELEGTLGPQPLPFELLPLTWDYAHDMYAWPELGAMVGLGTNVRWALGPRSELLLNFGMYAGYLGGRFEFSHQALFVRAGTYGIESSAAYDNTEIRLYTAQLGFNF